MKLLLLLGGGAFSLLFVGVAARYSAVNEVAPATPQAEEPATESGDLFSPLLATAILPERIEAEAAENATATVVATEEIPPQTSQPFYFPSDVELAELEWTKNLSDDVRQDVLGLTGLGWPFTEEEFMRVSEKFQGFYASGWRGFDREKTAIDMVVGPTKMLSYLDDERWRTLFESYHRDARLAEILVVPVTWVAEQRARLCPPPDEEGE